MSIEIGFPGKMLNLSEKYFGELEELIKEEDYVGGREIMGSSIANGEGSCSEEEFGA